MRNLFLSFAITIVSTAFVNAQNTNVQSEVTTTVRTVKDSEGEKKTVKNEVSKEVQNVQLGEEKPNTKNIEMKDSPVAISKSTEVINPDGSTRTVNVDRSATYESNSQKIQLILDAAGYKLVDLNTKKTSLLRKTSTNSYFFITKSKTAIAYFDTNNNLILEYYDVASDSVKIETYMKI
ncbi:hypothetical protein [Flavobacterium sp.]|uniref:hypothetical protein n=1 Tax=Flavobacterium sp. TaxID=239 RepID=UPI003D6BED49